jgi:hypothetical protein
MNGPAQGGAEPSKTAASVLKSKVEARVFDVFLCHNNRDKPQVKQIGEDLKAQGVLPWLDEWELRPGMPWQRALEAQIESVKSAAVFVGAEGVGPWQQNELDAFLRKFVQRERPVIPVLLPAAPSQPALPLFLEEMTWVDFRLADPNPMERLLWGITGERGGSRPAALLPERPAVASSPGPASQPDTFVSTAPLANLAEFLVGSWQVQITNAFGMATQVIAQFWPNGVFRGQLPTPMGMTMIEGSWQITPSGQLTLQGRQFIGFQVLPYVAMVQLKQTAPFQLTGMTSAGELTVWQKMA